ncbi:hypothetical protein CR513_37824, partial [Mucuna pruriens]
MWLTHLLGEFGISTSTPQLFCDNIGATYLRSDPIFHSRMKQIALDYDFVNKVNSMSPIYPKRINLHTFLPSLFPVPDLPNSETRWVSLMVTPSWGHNR